MKKLSVLITCLIATTTLFAQKPFEGHIKYSFQVMGDNADMMKSMMPTSMEMYSDKKSVMVKINGGMMGSMMGEMITTAKGSYIVKHDEKTIYNVATPPNKEEGAPTVVKEDEKLTIAGLECQKYKVTQTTTGGDQTSYIWINTDYIFPLTGAKGTEKMGVPGVPGIAMKMMTSQAGFTVVIIATEVEKGKQDKKYFELPKDYAKKDSAPTMSGF